MRNAKLNIKSGFCYLGVMLSTLFLASCNSGSSTQPTVSTTTVTDNLTTLASSKPLYSSADVDRMIPLKLLNQYDNFHIAVGGGALNSSKPPVGLNPDGSLDLFLDSGSPALIIPKYFLDPKKIKVLESCVVDYWGNIDDLVQGQILVKSARGGTSYKVDNFIFYAVRTIGDTCTSTKANSIGDFPNSDPYFTPGRWLPQRQAMMGIGTGLVNPTFNSKQYCVGSFFNFLDYSKYSLTKQPIFSIVSFGNALPTPPSPEKQIPFSMQSYISVGNADRGSNFNYSPMPNVSVPSSSCPAYGSWRYWNRSPISVSVESHELKLGLGQSPAGGHDDRGINSALPYAGVDTGGGGLGIVDAPGNPSITYLNSINALESQSLDGCYYIKAGKFVTVKLYNSTKSSTESIVVNNSYSYTTQPYTWGGYQATICPYSQGGGAGTGFTLFYAANTVSFDFANQRIGVSLGQIAPPSPLRLPHFFCDDWASMYNITSYSDWTTWSESTPTPFSLQFLWNDFACNKRILHPELFLFH